MTLGEGQRTAPRVSVVTVTYNAAATLQSTIDSVVAQDYSDLEYVVIDGGSTDGTIDIIRRNSAHIAYWMSEADSGIFDAMNKGAARATGEWMLFLNADDALHDARAISNMFAPGFDRAGRKVLYGHTVMRSRRGSTKLRRCKPLRTIHFKMPFSHQGAFINASLLRERPYDTAFRIAGDYDFFREVYDRYGRGAFGCRDVCVNYFRIGGASFQQPQVRNSEVARIIRRYEQGWRRPYYLFLYTIRCAIPEKMRGLLVDS